MKLTKCSRWYQTWFKDLKLNGSSYIIIRSRIKIENASTHFFPKIPHGLVGMAKSIESFIELVHVYQIDHIN
jgi:hypothetical protein